MTLPAPLRNPCPPGACTCGRDELLEQPGSDTRILLLTKSEEKRLLERLEQLRSLDDLRHLQQRMETQLGIHVSIAPGLHEVRSARGFVIELAEQPGLCRKTRQSIPAAIRKGLDNNPEVAWRLLDSFDLFGGL